MKRLFLMFLLFMLQFPDLNAEEKPPVIRLLLPDKTWALEFNSEGLKLQDHGVLPGFQGLKLQMNNSDNGMVMSVFFVPSEKKSTSAEYRDMVFESLKKTDIEISDVKKYEKDDKAFTEYTIKEYKDYKDLNQKNIFIYLVKDSTWIDLHLSKIKFMENDLELFNRFISSIHLLENYTPDCSENFSFGNYFYLNKEYPDAIKFYSKALDQEKVKASLDEEKYLLLIDNLGMAYGISGDLKNSKRIFEFGISRKPEFPNFYYNLACTYAEMDDVDNAIKNLKLAYKYKRNALKGETVPDPAQDSSFKKYFGNKDFQDFLKSIR